MKYVVMQSTSGNIIIKSEWTDKNSAKQAYHDTCRLLYSDAETQTAVVAILDESLDVVDGNKCYINKAE